MDDDINLETLCLTDITSDTKDDFSCCSSEFDVNVNNRQSMEGFRKSISYLSNDVKMGSKHFSLSGSIMPQNVYDTKENAVTVRLSADEKVWAVGLQDGQIKFYAVDNAPDATEPVNCLKDQNERYPVTDLVFISFDSLKSKEVKQFLLACYASGFIRLWHYKASNQRNKLIREWTEKYFSRTVSLAPEGVIYNQILCMSVSYDKQRFITGGDDQVIKVYEISSKQVVRILSKVEQYVLQTGKPNEAILEVQYHTMRITAIKYHPLGNTDPNYLHIFVSASWDNTIQIWDDRKLQSLWTYKGPHVCGNDGLDINPTTNTIITCSWRREKAAVQVWKFNEYILGSVQADMRSMNAQFSVPVAEYYQDSSNIISQGYVAQFIFGGQYIVYGGSNNNIFKIIDTDTFSPLCAAFNLKSAVVSIDFRKDKYKGSLLAVVSGNYLFIFLVDPVKKVSAGIK